MNQTYRDMGTSPQHSLLMPSVSSPRSTHPDTPVKHAETRGPGESRGVHVSKTVAISVGLTVLFSIIATAVVTLIYMLTMHLD